MIITMVYSVNTSGTICSFIVGIVELQAGGFKYPSRYIRSSFVEFPVICTAKVVLVNSSGE